MNPHWPTRGLYAITPDIADTDELIRRVEVVLQAGAAWLQYRNKAASAALRLEQARALQASCSRHAVPLVVNDDVRTAAEVGAAGVHLGEDDADPVLARRALGADALIGVSCYDDPARAQAAVHAGASYVAFGAFFASPTKPHARRASIELLRASSALGVPRVAIGGITPDNGRTLVAAGADLLAVISGVFDADDPAAAVQAYRRCFS